jgi:hypothetical protein
VDFLKEKLFGSRESTNSILDAISMLRPNGEKENNHETRTPGD